MIADTVSNHYGKIASGLAVAAFLANDEGFPKVAFALAGAAMAVLINPEILQKETDNA